MAGAKATVNPAPLPAVTPADIHDADEIRALVARTIASSVTQDDALLADTVANVDRNIDLWLAQPQRCLHLKACVEGRIVGVVLVKDLWNLCSLFVAPEWHGRGIGGALLEAACAACAGVSPKSAVFLNAAPRAVGFYLRHGFTPRETTQPLPAGFQAMGRPA
jgi:GNAT superfamily N-acetyltransferase